MKKNAIARIVIFSLLIFIFAGILIAGMCIENFSFQIGGTVDGLLKDGTEAATCSFFPEDIDEIVIIWISGNVDITGTAHNTVTYSTINNNTDFETAYKVENRRLTIAYNGKKWNTGKVKSKDLSLTLPQNWAGKVLKIEAVSADVCISSLSAVQKLQVENVSGQVDICAVVTENLNINTVSGDMTIAGKFQTVNIESVSARCTLDAGSGCPDSIDMDTVSGDFALYLPENYGFDLKLDGISKVLSTTLPYQKDGNRYLCSGKSGTCAIDMDSISGNISILERNPDPATCTHLWDEGKITTVPGDNRQEKVFTCLLCGHIITENVSPSKLFHITCADTKTENFLIEPLQSAYPSGYEVQLFTNVIMDADLHLYVNGTFACTSKAVAIGEQYYWIFTFIMPEEDVTIELKVVGGM